MAIRTAPKPDTSAPGPLWRSLVAEDDPWAQDAAFLAEVMVATYQQPRAQVRATAGVSGGVLGVGRHCLQPCAAASVPALQAAHALHSAPACPHRPSTAPTIHPQAEVVNAMPLYPTEAVLFDENQVPSVHYTGGWVRGSGGGGWGGVQGARASCSAAAVWQASQCASEG